MKRLLPLFLFILLVGCQESVSIKPEPSASAKADFAILSQGRKLFVVGNPDPGQAVKILWEICGSFVQSSCNIPVSRYQGKTGALLNNVPFTEDQYTVGYRIIMDDGVALVLKQSITLKGKDPILVSEYMTPKEIVDQAGLMVGKPLLDGLSVNVNKVILTGNKISLSLTDGESLSQDELDRRLSFLTKYIHPSKRDAIFPAMALLDFSYDDIAQTMWIKTKTYMPLDIYAGKDASKKWVRMVVKYSGKDWIFFDKVIIVSGTQRLESNLNHFDVKRDTFKGGVREWYDSSVGTKELAMLTTLRHNTGQIRFSGKYSDTQIISPIQSRNLDAVMSVYDAMN